MTEFPLPPALATELQHVEQILLERIRSRAAVISVAGSHLMTGLRPRMYASLVLMAAQIGSYQRDLVVHAAAAVELIRAATLTHDDLVDEAERRRGRSRAGEWGQGVTLMVGNYLFALASSEMALSPDPRVIGFFAQAVLRITEENLTPPAALSPPEKAHAYHLERLGGASALFEAATLAGGACGGAPAEQIEALGRFGHSLGLAMALGDEVGDFAAAADEAGARLRAGVVTLPLIFAATAGEGPRLATALDSDDPASQAWALAEVRRHGLAPTRAEIARLAGEARAALAGLPPGEAREALARVADYAAARAG